MTRKGKRRKVEPQEEPSNPLSAMEQAADYQGLGLVDWANAVAEPFGARAVRTSSGRSRIRHVEALAAKTRAANKKQRERSKRGNETKQDTREGRRREVKRLAKEPECAGLSQRDVAKRLAELIPRENPRDPTDDTRRWSAGTIREDLRILGMK